MEGQASDVAGSQDSAVGDTCVSEDQVLASPESIDDEMQFLSGGDDNVEGGEKDKHDEDILASVEDVLAPDTGDLDEGIVDGSFANDDPGIVVDTQHLGLDIDMGLSKEGQSPVQNSQNGQQDSHVNVRDTSSSPARNSQTPTVHIQARQSCSDEDSLFMPMERRPTPTPHSARGISATFGSLNRPSATSSLLRGPSNTPASTTQPALSGTPTATNLAPRAAAKPSTSRYSRIKEMQKMMSHSRATAARPQLVQSASRGETYLDSILERGSRQQTSVDFITAEVDEDTRADRVARAKFEKQKAHYEEIKKKKGKLGFAEHVAWIRIESDERLRQQKIKRDQDMARREQGEDDMLLETFGPSTGLDENDQAETAIDDDPAGSSRIRDPSSRENFPSMLDAEIRSMKVALQAAGDRPGKKRKGEDTQDYVRSRNNSKRSKVKASKSNSTAQARPGARQTAKDRKVAQNAARMHASLMHSDVFRQQAAQDTPDQPTFTSRIKSDALKELIASVPSEHQKSVKDDTTALLRATKDFDGKGSCKADGNGMWKVKGMATSLKHYQVMGTAFMRRRENDTREPRGGLMADQMGLGKTIMMLANVVNGLGNNDQECKTTLLVASPALLTQWSREIGLHTESKLIVMRYNSGSRISDSNDIDVFKQFHFVLTTYHEVLRSYPKYDPPKECQTDEEKAAWWEDVYEKRRGALHRIMFHRIVLDEAQAIKNHQSRTSIACRALMARHKWALSGTPILNSLDELYPYFKFLDVPHTGSFEDFKKTYADPKQSQCTDRLLIRLAQFMIRRDHSDIMMNAPILKLPKASQMTHWCDFNSVERSIYNVVEYRFVERINAQDKSEKSYNNMLVLLLRLRQLTAHILMLQKVVQDLLEQEDIEKIREIVQRQATDQRSRQGRTIIAIRKQLDNLEVEAKKRPANKVTNRSKNTKRMYTQSNIVNSEDHDIEELLDDSQDDGHTPHTGSARGSGSNFGKNFDFRPYFNSLTTGTTWEKVKQRATCSDCGGPPIGAWVTSCGHLLCAKCYDSSWLQAAEAEQTHVSCPACGSIFTHANQVDGNEAGGPRTRTRTQKHSKEIQRIEQEDIAEEWLNFGGEGVLPSAKTIALKAQLLNWITENPDVKIIIYTQFLAMIRIIGKICEEERWETDEYHGKMSLEARDKAIKHFASNGNVRILLASLRCGGLGLNLTMASRVVILDPWWNSAAEQQAFCRVFRFGQTEKTCLTRFCVRNTVDDRLIRMQERKEKEIDSVMKEDAGAKARKMTIRDLMELFGDIRDDNQGRPFILVDNVDPHAGFHADRDHEGYADEH